MDMEIVSVIIPVYNVEKYLKECVDSLRQQTYKNLEIILVDDGSQDKCGEICDEYLQKDNRVKVIHKANAGLGFARNSGLEIATGKYVAFLDSDDVAEPDLVEKLMSKALQNKADTCIGGFKRMTEDGKIVSQERYTEAVFRGDAVYNKLFARMLGSSPDAHDAVKMGATNVLYSMDIIREYKLLFPSERELISEDIIWNLEYFKHSQCAVLLGDSAYRYRITPGSLTQKYNPQRIDMICALYEEIEKRLDGDMNKIVRLQRQFFVNLRSCIRQESRDLSGKNGTEIRKSINWILNYSVVQRVAAEYLKCIKQFKQKVFVFLVKEKCTGLLFLLLESKML